jgi:hypothetical protein
VTWTRRGFLAIVATSLAACRSSTAPRPRASTFSAISGTWSGTIAGRELAAAAGPVETSAWLTIDDDGRWALRAGAAVASGTARLTSGAIVLDGRMQGGDPVLVGRAVSVVVEPRGPASLYGRGQLFHLGQRVDVVITLRRFGA